MSGFRLRKMRPIRVVASLLFLVGLALLAFGGNTRVSASSNKGDVWVDNVGQPAGPGHENDPHLACADINIWGNHLADSSGTYTVDGWPPSGGGEQDYPASGSAAWTYNTANGGDQVVSVINVQQLIATAKANGDVAQAQQGFHFKLQFSQDPQKHKTFWVDCPSATPTPTPSATPTATPTGSVQGNTPTPTASATPTATPTGSVEGITPTPTSSATPTATPTGAVQGITPVPTPTAPSAPTPTSGVLAVTTPDTGGGGPSTSEAGVVFLFIGALLLAMTARRRLWS